MTWGNNGAGPVGVPPFQNNGVNAPGQAGAAYPPLYNAGFESLMAAVSRGEVSLNQVAQVSGLGGIGNANGNPTLLQSISQGVPQNGTNGLGVSSGPKVGEGNGGPGSAVMAASGNSSTAFGNTPINDAKQMENAPAVALANPIQYGGN